MEEIKNDALIKITERLIKDNNDLYASNILLSSAINCAKNVIKKEKQLNVLAWSITSAILVSNVYNKLKNIKKGYKTKG